MEIRKRVAKISGTTAIISSVFYLSAEIISVIFCSSPKNALYGHTISELGIPLGYLVEGQVNDFSPMYALMNSALIVCGLLYMPCYTACFYDFDSRFKRTVCFVLATLTGIGVTMVGIFHAGNPAVADIHGLSASTCFICGNILTVFTGVFYRGENFTRLSRTAIILGAIGLTGTVITLILEYYSLSRYEGFHERIAVYSLIIWLMLAGAYRLKRAKKAA